MNSQSSNARHIRSRWPNGPGFIAFVISLIVSAAFLIRAFRPDRGERPFADSRQLAHLGQALLMYELDHHGRYPASLSKLLRAEGLPSEMCRDPDNNVDYVFFGAGQLATQFGPKDVVIADPENPDVSGGDVLWGDGSVTFLDTVDFRNATKPRAFQE